MQRNGQKFDGRIIVLSLTNLLGYNNHFANTQIRPLFTSFLSSPVQCGFWKVNTQTHEVNTERGEGAGPLENQYRLLFCCEVPTSLSKTAASSSCFRFDKFSFVLPQIKAFFTLRTTVCTELYDRRTYLLLQKLYLPPTSDAKAQLYNVKKSIRQGVKCYFKSNFLTAGSKIFWDLCLRR